MLFREWKYFCTALQFLTLVPVPSCKDFEPYWLDNGAKYFPLVGALIGLLCAGIHALAGLMFDAALPGLFAVLAAIAITGALHEDGLADFCDSLGGRTIEHRLAIMKDSRTGTYGVLALLAAFSIKLLALAQLPPPLAMASLVCMHAGGRAAAVAVIAALPYAGDPMLAKVKPLAQGVKPAHLILALAFGLLPFLLLPLPAALTAVMAGAAAAVLVAALAKMLLKGFTGDVLGAVEQTVETCVLLGVVACV
jgi:adenosylcobinamide-GDP ribazoletransferase